MIRNIINNTIVLSLLLSACQALPVVESTATPTATNDATPTVTPPPTLTPVPTLPPVVRVDSGDKALFLGDYDKAREEYNTAFEQSTDNGLKAAALWGLGRTEFDSENYQGAIDTFTLLTREYPDSTYSARAYFLMGQAYYKLKNYELAANEYNVYLTRVPGVLDGYVQEYRGDAFYTLGRYTDAMNAYQAALNASRLDNGLTLQIKIAQSRFDFGDYAGALAMFEDIFNTSNNDYIRAQMEYFIGNTYIRLGQNDQAYARYLHTVENYPLSQYAYFSLVALVNANVPVSDLNRGIVDYFAEQYDIALVAFDRYIAANQVNDGTAPYYRALTLKGMGRNDDAVKALAKFIKEYPSHPRWVEAWEEKAALEWIIMGDLEAGTKTYLDFVALVPTASNAPDFLMTAARVTERQNKLEEAAQLWERVANEYSGSEKVPDALFLAGITKYRLQDYKNALTLFQRGLILSTKAEDRARVYFWMGKTQDILGEKTTAEQSWQQGQLTDPYGYYSLRSMDALLRRDVFESSPSLNLNIDLPKERKDAEVWMRLTFDLPPDTDLTGPGTLAQDPRFIRGTELWEMGLYDEARLEFEDLREAVKENAIDSFRLANHLLDIGLYRSAIFAAREVLTLAGLDSQSASLTAPAYFNHVRYGLYYQELIIPEEARYNLDQLFMFSVIRQESLFEGFVRSNAGARGLMQIIPPTGQQIANELDWPNGYYEDDLYRPNVSVRFGTYYLDKNRRLLGNSLYGSLAAYNAGPGNALVWKELAGDDPDLFLEIVRFQETRDYIRLIYEIFNTYRIVYGTGR